MEWRHGDRVVVVVADQYSADDARTSAGSQPGWTGDFLFASRHNDRSHVARTTSVTKTPDDPGASGCSHVATVCHNHLLPTCSLTVGVSAHVNITTHQDGPASARRRRWQHRQLHANCGCRRLICSPDEALDPDFGETKAPRGVDRLLRARARTLATAENADTPPSRSAGVPKRPRGWRTSRLWRPTSGRCSGTRLSPNPGPAERRTRFVICPM